MRGALITVRCDCGQTRYVPYGEQWLCERCGRQWNTSQIPAEEYWGIMHQMRRYRFVAMGVALGSVGAALILGFTLHARFMLLLPLVFGFWFLLYMPRWRQKVRRRTRELPTWKLHPE